MRLPLLAPIVAALLAIAVGGAAQSATPTPKPTALAPVPTPSEQAKREGRALLAKVVEGFGGKEKVGRVRDVQTKATITVKTEQGDITMDVSAAMIFPDRLVQRVDGPFGNASMAVGPAGAFLAGANTAQDLPEAMRQELVKQVKRIPLFLVQKAEDPELSAAAAGSEKIGAVETKILDLAYQGATTRWFVDPSNGRILRARHSSVGVDGKPVTIASDYSDFRMIDGFPVPFHLEVEQNGVKDQSVTLQECVINPGVDPKLFIKPTPVPAVTPTPASATS